MINLYKFLYEENEKSPETGSQDARVGNRTRLAKDSVDDQIDALLIKYESESMLEEQKAYSLEKLIFEAEDDEEAEEVEDDEEAVGAVGSEKIDVTAAAEEEQPDIDIDRFSASVARLILNYKKLLNIESVILNRVKNFFKENKYDQSYTDRFLDILDSQFDIKAVDNQIDYYNANPPEHDAPYSVGAYDAGSGGGGA